MADQAAQNQLYSMLLNSLQENSRNLNKFVMYLERQNSVLTQNKSGMERNINSLQLELEASQTANKGLQGKVERLTKIIENGFVDPEPEDENAVVVDENTELPEEHVVDAETQDNILETSSGAVEVVAVVDEIVAAEPAK